MRERIIKLLNTTPDKYEERVFKTYTAWCLKRADNEMHFQMILANAAVAKWFIFEYNKREKEFLSLIGARHINFASAEYHYQGCITDIYTVWPKPLIEMSKPVERETLIHKVANQFDVYVN